MKMELITKKHNGLDEEAMVIIAKDEFIKIYEFDKEKAFAEVEAIVDMFTSPQCFSMEFTMEKLEEIYETLKSSECKGVALVYTELEDGELGMEFCRVK